MVTQEDSFCGAGRGNYGKALFITTVPVLFTKGSVLFKTRAILFKKGVSLLNKGEVLL